MRKLIASGIALSLMFSVVFSAEPCTSDFASFLLKFKSTQAFQIQNTRFPLFATYVDRSALPEPKTVTYKISNASDWQYSRLNYPSKTRQAAIPFEKKVKLRHGHFSVQFTKPESDYSFAFSFEKTAFCWQLVRLDDYSL